MILWSYIIISGWYALLVALWLRMFLITCLSFANVSFISWLLPYSWTLMIVGFLLAVWGKMTTLWEVIYHREFERDMDTVAVYAGSTLILTGGLFQPTLTEYMGLAMVMVLVGTHAGVTLNRLLTTWTHTFVGVTISLVTLIACLSMGTWLSMKIIALP